MFMGKIGSSYLGPTSYGCRNDSDYGRSNHRVDQCLFATLLTNDYTTPPPFLSNDVIHSLSDVTELGRIASNDHVTGGKHVHFVTAAREKLPLEFVAVGRQRENAFALGPIRCAFAHLREVCYNIARLG